jgi:hypothetical protein
LLEATLWMAGFLGGGLCSRLLLDLFEGQLQLIERQGLGPRPKR